MPETWVESWKRVGDKTNAEKVLTHIARPDYVPTTSAKLAVNELGMSGPLHSKYTKARDQLAELGFIRYEWGEPIQLSTEFREFVINQGSDWMQVLKSQREAKPESETPTPLEPPIKKRAGYPADVEDEVLWDRFDKLIQPMLESEISHTGEVLPVQTARQGRRSTGGKFSRPDLTYLLVGRYPLLGQRYVDIVAVEVKTWVNSDNVGNAYEAVAYTRFSTLVYYAYESPTEVDRISREVESILVENGIGVIRIWRQGNQDRMYVDATPERKTPSQAKLEAYLETLREIDGRGVEKLLQSKYR